MSLYQLTSDGILRLICNVHFWHQSGSTLNVERIILNSQLLAPGIPYPLALPMIPNGRYTQLLGEIRQGPSSRLIDHGPSIISAEDNNSE